jgi:23S rRNA (uracil1939-C5)-methyltransferase
MDDRINDTLAVLQEYHESLTRRPSPLKAKDMRLHQIAVRHGVVTDDLLINPDLKDRGVPLATGQPLYHEALLGRRFQVSAASFFQVNTPQAETLVKMVVERLELTGAETIVDAYAGVGTFAALLAGQAKRVIAIEESSSAIRDAKVNLADLGNVELIAGKVERVLPDLDVVPDAVILDPPRAGCFPVVLQALIEWAPKRVVYVSCDPATLARDLAILRDGGYTLTEAVPVDLFPQTYHIETVASLRHA